MRAGRQARKETAEKFDRYQRLLRIARDQDHRRASLLNLLSLAKEQGDAAQADAYRTQALEAYDKAIKVTEDIAALTHDPTVFPSIRRKESMVQVQEAAAKRLGELRDEKSKIESGEAGG